MQWYLGDIKMQLGEGQSSNLAMQPVWAKEKQNLHKNKKAWHQKDTCLTCLLLKPKMQ